MNILIDTNILLDIILNRAPFAESAEQVFVAA
jgi:predicted nucleic acid-binding protein